MYLMQTTKSYGTVEELGETRLRVIEARSYAASKEQTGTGLELEAIIGL